jgi:hypothetical protein
MLETLNADGEYHAGDKAIIMLDGEERSGVALGGYDSDIEALVSLFMHLRAIFAANGKDLQLHALREG